MVEVAVKTTKPAASSDKEKEGFLKEMRIMSLMMHPNIVKLYGLVQDGACYTHTHTLSG